MSDDPHRSAKEKRNQDGGAVVSLAGQALSVLASRRTGLTSRSLGELIDRLEAAVLDRNPEQRLSVLADMRAAGVPDVEIAEDIIPEVARRLGTAWCEDNMSFADVTIGSARLQALVRDLGAPDPEPTAAPAGTVAVIVPPDESHTLGAMVLTSRLRRQRISVRLMLGSDEASILSALRTTSHDAILLSASHSEKLVKLDELVNKIRRVLPRPTPIIVGGSVAERGVAVERHVRADYVTSNVEEVFQQCGVKIVGKDGAQPIPKRLEAARRK